MCRWTEDSGDTWADVLSDPSGQVRPTLLTPVYLHYDTAAVKPDTSTFTFTTQYPVVTQQCWKHWSIMQFASQDASV